ncbi:hypothetical protein NDI45_10600 [Leptolyngbya sp. GB1-A1]|uniref:hypothetical protein n=1 Tax=Leptolyngbya sp. GB1-A1 TaxID=2933908 RepID=UPI00329A5F98
MKFWEKTILIEGSPFISQIVQIVIFRVAFCADRPSNLSFNPQVSDRPTQMIELS